MDEGHLGWVCGLRMGGLRAHLQKHLSAHRNTDSRTERCLTQVDILCTKTRLKYVFMVQ